MMYSEEYKRAMGIDSQNRNNNSNSNNSINNIAKIIKVIAILEAISGLILGLMLIKEIETMSIIIIVVGFISAVFIYALGEIIQLLEDIKNK